MLAFVCLLLTVFSVLQHFELQRLRRRLDFVVAVADRILEGRSDG